MVSAVFSDCRVETIVVKLVVKYIDCTCSTCYLRLHLQYLIVSFRSILSPLITALLFPFGFGLSLVFLEQL